MPLFSTGCESDTGDNLYNPVAGAARRGLTRPTTMDLRRCFSIPRSTSEFGLNPSKTLRVTMRTRMRMIPSSRKFTKRSHRSLVKYRVFDFGFAKRTQKATEVKASGDLQIHRLNRKNCFAVMLLVQPSSNALARTMVGSETLNGF